MDAVWNAELKDNMLNLCRVSHNGRGRHFHQAGAGFGILLFLGLKIAFSAR